MRILYQCDYCELLSINKDEMLEHEQACEENPLRRMCNTCKHLLKSIDNEIYPHFDKCLTGKHDPETNRGCGSLLGEQTPCPDWVVKTSSPDRNVKNSCLECVCFTNKVDNTETPVKRGCNHPNIVFDNENFEEFNNMDCKEWMQI